MKEMKVYVMRHGETDWNARHLFQGQVNTSLNEKGREQARKAENLRKHAGLLIDGENSCGIIPCV